MKEDWVECRLGDVCNITMGQSPPSSSYNSNREGIPFFQGKAEFTDKYPIQKIWCNAPKKIAYPNNILLSVRAPVGSTNIANQKCCIGRGLASISYSYNINFIWYFLKKNEVNLDAKGTGTTFKSISKNVLQDFPIPLPPLPIQRAIVSKIETLFTSLDKGIADLKTAQEQLKIYRQAVLKKAFEGELTRKWREEQALSGDEVPTADELLEEIKLERKTYYENQLKEWEADVKKWEKNGKKGSKPGKPSKLIIPDSPNSDHERRKWGIPNTWAWAQLGLIAFVTKLAGFEYTKYVKYDDSGDLFVIKAENAGRSGFKKTDFSKVNSKTVLSLTRSFLFGGELLVVFVGAGTGNVALVPRDKRYFLGPNIGMARAYIKINMRYLELFLQSLSGKNLMMATVKAVAQPSLSMGTIRQTPIALCSLPEQNQIVLEIEKRLSVCDKLEESISESLEKAKALRQSILKKAFDGKLLTPNEIEACKREKDYEPASELLKKIKLEKENIV